MKDEDLGYSSEVEYFLGIHEPWGPATVLKITELKGLMTNPGRRTTVARSTAIEMSMEEKDLLVSCSFRSGTITSQESVMSLLPLPGDSVNQQIEDSTFSKSYRHVPIDKGTP